MRMLCCPRRSPFNASSWFPGGTLKLANSVAACSCKSFRRATRSMFLNLGTTWLRKSASVSRQVNEWIMFTLCSVSRNLSNRPENEPAEGRSPSALPLRSSRPSGLTRNRFGFWTSRVRPCRTGCGGRSGGLRPCSSPLPIGLGRSCRVKGSLRPPGWPVSSPSAAGRASHPYGP